MNNFFLVVCFFILATDRAIGETSGVIDLDVCSVEVPHEFFESKASGMYYQNKTLGAGYLLLENVGAKESKSKYSRDPYRFRSELVVNSLDVSMLSYSFEGNAQEFLMALISSNSKTIVVANMDEEFILELARSCIKSE